MTATTASARTGWQLPRLHGLSWVTWRQHRVALAGAVMLLGGFGLFMVISGLAMHSEYTRLSLSTCGTLSDPGCGVPLRIFQHEWGNWARQLPQFLTFLPGLLGVFVGAPVVARELESGTFRFAWTQGRNRVQWITTKLVLLGVTLTVLALGFSALFSWWYGPFGTLIGRMGSGGTYEVAGVVFAARTLFGFMLGALLGTLIRRTVPAMAATAAGWLAVAWPSVVYLRPLIQTPITAMDAPFATRGGGWVINTWPKTLPATTSTKADCSIRRAPAGPTRPASSKPGWTNTTTRTGFPTSPKAGSGTSRSSRRPRTSRSLCYSAARRSGGCTVALPNPISGRRVSRRSRHTTWDGRTGGWPFGVASCSESWRTRRPSMSSIETRMK
jgi:hypothetical protein